MLIKRLFFLLFLASAVTGAWHTLKPAPRGTAYESPEIRTDQVSFLTDVTYERDGAQVREQEIFQEAFRMIDAARRFVVLDVFLFNDDYERSKTFDPLARQLTEKLVAAAGRGVPVVVVTDPINTFYGAYENPYLSRLEDAGVQVVITALEPLRDSNPIYSGPYRLLGAPFGVSQARTLTNPFSPDSPKVSVSALLKMLNFKANHRKLVATEEGLLVMSANPHDASSNHSNIALSVKAPALVAAALEAEQGVAELSGAQADLAALAEPPADEATAGQYGVRLLTESKIRDRVREAVQRAGAGDRIDVAVFYLSHRGLIEDLAAAAGRGAQVRLLLDANKDAFGRQKNGVPNRQAAMELVRRGHGNIAVRWALTHGEQFHSKMIQVTTGETAVLIGGSCNFTRRNFDDLNLEANLMVTGPSSGAVFTEAEAWFQRLWQNEGAEFSGELSLYADDSLPKVLLYRLMEATGLSTF